jgi:2-polyprenyl-3-methyl-5-hydroxy-6-metoxy-1,4-benzoquinol methylase
MSLIVKEFWNARPCNIRHSKKPVGTKEYFDEVEKKRYFVEPHNLRFADFNKWKGKRVLELGCGIGTDSVRFAKAGADLTLVDISDKSIEMTKQRLEVYGLKANIFTGNLEELSSFLPKQTFDLIYSYGVIHHAQYPERIINEIKYYCNKDTIIKIMLYSKFSWKGITFFLTHGHKFNFNYLKTIKYFAEAQLNCPYAYTYSKKELKNLFKDFKILDIEKTHIFPYKISDYIKDRYNKTLFFKLLPEFLFCYLKRILGWHFLITLKKA